MSKVKENREGDDMYFFMCPGCNDAHHIATSNKVWKDRYVWQFNGDIDKPTFRPSIVMKTGTYVDPNIKGDPQWLKEHSHLCHSFVTDGKIQFLSDCSHKLAGQTVDLPELENE